MAGNEMIRRGSIHADGGSIYAGPVTRDFPAIKGNLSGVIEGERVPMIKMQSRKRTLSSQVRDRCFMQRTIESLGRQDLPSRRYHNRCLRL